MPAAGSPSAKHPSGDEVGAAGAGEQPLAQLDAEPQGQLAADVRRGAPAGAGFAVAPAAATGSGVFPMTKS